MPIKSKAQFRFMKAAEHGDVGPGGPSKEAAREFTKGMTKKRFARLKEKLGKKKD